jgi:hypothetical protein
MSRVCNCWLLSITPKRPLLQKHHRNCARRRRSGTIKSNSFFRAEGYFRIDLRMGNVNWDWLRIRCAKKVPASVNELNVQGSGTLYIEVLWTREPPRNHPLDHYVINARSVLQRYGYRLVVSPGTAFVASRLIDFASDIVCSPAGNLDVLNKIVTARREYLRKTALVVVLGAARQHTDADLDPNALLGKMIGREYGVFGNPYVVINFKKTSADGMTLLHEMGHAAGFHGHEDDEGRRTAVSHHRIMSYGPRRNTLTAEQVENFNKAFFRRM